MNTVEIKEMAEKLSEYFIETVASWTDDAEKKAYEFKSCYLSDFSYSLYPELSDEERKAVIDEAEKITE